MSRVDLRCPLCGDTVNVDLRVEPKLIHSAGNGRKGFLTADVGVGGMEHTCPVPGAITATVKP